MCNQVLSWTWTTAGPLHIGNGFSRAGFVDRAVRLDPAGHAICPGSAVKGAIRGSAEQLVRWLLASSGHPLPEESDRESFPRSEVVRRIFAPGDRGPLYRFTGCRSMLPCRPQTYSSTRIDLSSGSAMDQTLRTIEFLPKGIVFEGRIELSGGDWSHDNDSSDGKDALFLAAAIAATERIGGKKGLGTGRVLCGNIAVTGRPLTEELTSGTIFSLLRQHCLDAGKSAMFPQPIQHEEEPPLAR